MSAGAGLSTLPDAREAGKQAAMQAVAALGETPDIAVVFFSHHHIEDVGRLMAPILAELAPASVMGCSTQAVIGDGHEIEHGPGVSIWCGRSAPGASVEPFHVQVEQMHDGAAIVGFPLFAHDATAILLLADPHTFPAGALLQSLNQDYPGLPVLGGMAGGSPDHNVVVLDGNIRDEGAVGMLLRGVDVHGVVSQGCRPIGSPMVVTAIEDNIILELAGAPPLQKLQQAVSALPPEDHHLVANGLQLGVVIDESNESPEMGDFLVRPIYNANTRTGAIISGEQVRVGQTVQFQLRDPRSASKELTAMLSARAGASSALLFTCNGRGTNMFGEADHDIHLLEDSLGPIPVAGMFCNGEFGAIGGRNFIHGLTASVALFD